MGLLQVGIPSVLGHMACKQALLSLLLLGDPKDLVSMEMFHPDVVEVADTVRGPICEQQLLQQQQQHVLQLLLDVVIGLPKDYLHRILRKNMMHPAVQVGEWMVNEGEVVLSLNVHLPFVFHQFQVQVLGVPVVVVDSQWQCQQVLLNLFKKVHVGNEIALMPIGNKCTINSYNIFLI